MNILQEKFIKRSEPNQRGHPTKLLSFQDAIELIMVLPGNVAKESRKQFGDILTRYIAGAPSLIGEIRANALSDSPIAQMARAADAGSTLGKRAAVEPPSLELISVEVQKGTNCMIAAVTTFSAQVSGAVVSVKGEVEKVAGEVVSVKEEVVSVKEEVVSVKDEVVSMKGDVVSLKDTVVTVVDHSKEVSTLVHIAKVAERKAQQSEHISHQATGRNGAKAAKKVKLIRKELVEEKNKVGVLTRQVGDFQKCIGELREAVEDNTAGQIEINANQDDIKASMEEIKGNYPKILLCFDEILGSHDHTNDNYKKMDARLQEMDARQKEMDARQKEMDARQKKILSLLEAMMRSGP